MSRKEWARSLPGSLEAGRCVFKRAHSSSESYQKNFRTKTLAFALRHRRPAGSEIVGVVVGDGGLPGAIRPYTEITIERETEYVFRAGQPVYELVSPDGQVYVMQSYSQIVAPALTEEDLLALGDRLDLPEGWRYRVRELDRDFTVRTVGGLAHVIQDDLENTYQRVDE